ncbi:MAG: SNF2-related protein [bacterium]
MLVASYGVLSRDAAVLAKVAWGRVVFDEAQQLKNPHTAVARAAAGLGAARRIALTGTPVENRLLELWALLQLLNPGLLGRLSQFRQRFALPIERDHDAEAAERLRRLTAPFLLRASRATPRSCRTCLAASSRPSFARSARSRPRYTKRWRRSCWSRPSRARASPARGWCWPG